MLEVGAGTGTDASLPQLRPGGPGRRLRARSRDAPTDGRQAVRGTRPVEIADTAAESLPYADASFDAVIFGCTLYTVADRTAP